MYTYSQGLTNSRYQTTKVQSRQKNLLGKISARPHAFIMDACFDSIVLTI